LHQENQSLLKKINDFEVLKSGKIMEKENEKIFNQLKVRVHFLENENQHLKEKYESLIDIDSPIKEVSTMRLLIKNTDEKLMILQKENLDLNEKLRQAYDQIDNLKEIDSPTKDSKNLKSLFIENEENLNKLKEENASMIEKLKSINELESSNKELQLKNQELIKEYAELEEKYLGLREAESPMKDVNDIKQIFKKSDEKLNQYKSEILALKNQILSFEGIQNEKADLTHELHEKTQFYNNLLREFNLIKEKFFTLEVEDKELKASAQEIKIKYESLRDVDSPVEEISQLKSLLKNNDEKLEVLKSEKQEFLIKVEKLESESLLDERIIQLKTIENEKEKIIQELKAKVIFLDNENQQLKEKYESLRDIDSPVKEVSSLRKLIKSNDEKLAFLQKENLDLNEKLKESYDQIDNLKEIDSPTKESKKMKNLFIENEVNLSKLKEENSSLLEKVKKFIELESSNKELQLKNQELMKNYSELEEKYLGLREAESPVKGVNEIKQLLKKTDEKLNQYKSENLALKTQILSLEGIQNEKADLIQENKDKIQVYNNLLKDFNIIKEKFFILEVENKELKASTQEKQELIFKLQKIEHGSLRDDRIIDLEN